MQNRRILRTIKSHFQRTMKETIYRYQFIKCKQNTNELPQKFLSRLKQKAALCNCEDTEDSLAKIIFTQILRKPQIHTDVLSENRKQKENQQRMTNISTLLKNTNSQRQTKIHSSTTQTMGKQTTKKKNTPSAKTGPIPHFLKCVWNFQFVSPDI